MQDKLLNFLISLITAVVVLFALGPMMLKVYDLHPGGGATAAQADAGKAGVPEAEPVAPVAKTAPNLEGQELQEARERWRKEGIVIIKENARADASAEPGTILEQIPAAGAPLEQDEIRVTIAEAPDLIVVPEVTGQALDKATAGLTGAGFEVPPPTEESSSEAAGTVLKQEPPAGQEAERGSPVQLVVSGQGEAILVPKVTSKRIAGARKAIEAAGLAVGSVREREDEELSGGRVIAQTPKAGESVPPGTAVNLVIVAPD